MIVRRVKTTKLDIIKCAAKLFFEKGYSATSPRQICDILDLSTGNITYYFPTKEHLLSVFVEMLCQYQWQMVLDETDTVTAVCLELAAMAVLCDENDVARDFYTSAYTSPMCLGLIRKSDTRRAKEVFGGCCPDWTDQQFEEAEVLASGIAYATLAKTEGCPPIEVRVAGAVQAVLGIYGFSKEERLAVTERVMAADRRALALKMLTEFRAFIDHCNEKELERLIEAKQNQIKKRQ